VDTYIGSLQESIEFEAETEQLCADYIARRSAETDAEYGWPAGTTARLWDTQHARWHNWNGDGQQR
jgi:hypothetical protein